ncbi:hypothetical protein LCI18_003250 [Fusarium solani-melongenae]|uniref:Uncharacterized protein n=1 Tax=Fusarium solani subsp. cucurbitae TaxID=2747967 RepID=A0ACD3YTR6_FUSSC|nr:hypothetical protein LCI18_003250 [Fusarium solani-melongenae]
MPSEWSKFYLVGAAGGTTPMAEDLYYHWGVIHAALFLGTRSPNENFVRYAQNYVNPDVPDEARLIRAHPTVRYRIFSDHWSNEWSNTVQSIEDPSHAARMGRHHFGDASTIRAFFGRGGPVYKSPDFAHPAGLTIGHFLGLPDGVTRAEALIQLDQHKLLLVSKLREFGKSCKYTVDICNDAWDRDIRDSKLSNFPRSNFFAVRTYSVYF